VLPTITKLHPSTTRKNMRGSQRRKTTAVSTTTTTMSKKNNTHTMVTTTTTTMRLNIATLDMKNLIINLAVVYIGRALPIRSEEE
jgi:hypothetical protein